MRHLASRRDLLLGLGLFLLVLVSCSPAPRGIDRALPDDTLFWMRLDRLATLEAALDQQGLMDLLVAELDKPDRRDHVLTDLGLAISDDPRADIHAVMADLVRADVTVHPAAGDTTTGDPRVFVSLEAKDEAAASNLEAFLVEHARETRAWDDTPVHVLGDADDPVLVWRDGVRLLASDDPDLLREMRARLEDAPDPGLVGTDDYQRCHRDSDHDLQVYVAPEFQNLAGWPFDASTAYTAPGMHSLMEKYGSQASWMGIDYLLTGMVVRSTYEPGSVLIPFTECPSGRSQLLDQLPADTYAAEVCLVHEGARKATLFKELYREVMAANPSSAAMNPMAAAPFEVVESTLGFTLEDIMGPLAEVAFAGVPDAGFVVLLRTHDETEGEAMYDRFGASPVLNFLSEGEPRDISGCRLRTFHSPMDAEGRVFALGHRGDTVMLVVAAKTTAGLDAFVSGEQVGKLPDAAPAPAKAHLQGEAYGWFMTDMAGLAAEWDIPLDEVFEDLPPAVAARLATLVVGGHTVVPSPGTVEAVFEMSGP